MLSQGPLKLSHGVVSTQVYCSAWSPESVFLTTSLSEVNNLRFGVADIAVVSPVEKGQFGVVRRAVDFDLLDNSHLLVLG